MCMKISRSEEKKAKKGMSNSATSLLTGIVAKTEEKPTIKRTSAIFEPIMTPSASSGCFLYAEIAAVAISGIEVPTATTLALINNFEIPNTDARETTDQISILPLNKMPISPRDIQKMMQGRDFSDTGASLLACCDADVETILTEACLFR